MRNISNAKQRWSLRKLSVGVCSVLLGMTIMGAQTASANTNVQSSASSASMVNRSETENDASQVVGQRQEKAIQAQNQYKDAQQNEQAASQAVNGSQNSLKSANQKLSDAQSKANSQKAVVNSAQSAQTSTQMKLSKLRVRLI